MTRSIATFMTPSHAAVIGTPASHTLLEAYTVREALLWSIDGAYAMPDHVLDGLITGL